LTYIKLSRELILDIRVSRNDVPAVGVFAF